MQTNAIMLVTASHLLSLTLATITHRLSNACNALLARRLHQRNADMCRLQCTDVIRAIATHQCGAACCAMQLQDELLLIRRDTREHLRATAWYYMAALGSITREAPTARLII